MQQCRTPRAKHLSCYTHAETVPSWPRYPKRIALLDTSAASQSVPRSLLLPAIVAGARPTRPRNDEFLTNLGRRGWDESKTAQLAGNCRLAGQKKQRGSLFFWLSLASANWHRCAKGLTQARGSGTAVQGASGVIVTLMCGRTTYRQTTPAVMCGHTTFTCRCREQFVPLRRVISHVI